MSGGVGPTFSDIRFPKDQEPSPSPSRPAVDGIKAVSYFGFSTLRQLNAVSIAVVFAATGMVSLEDVAFSLLSLLYTFFIAMSIFPATGGKSVGGEESRAETALSTAGAVLGLALPVAYVFEGIMEGDRKGIAAAAPHVFLLASRMFVEGLAGDRGFSPPVKAFVRVLFNVRLLFAISSWVREETAKTAAAPGPWPARRLCIGRGLAAANLAYWSLYLFGFLLPVCLPKAFKRYYGKVKE